MNTVSLLVAALATWQIIEIWHHGSIFASLRARVELWGGFWADLLMCPFCLSVWVGLFTATWMFVADRLGYRAIAWPLYGFAVARLSNLGNDVFRKSCRTPQQTVDGSN